MEPKNEQTEVDESLDLPEVAEGQEDTTDWKAEAQKLREKAIAQRERTKALKQAKAEAEAKLVELAKASPKEPSQPKTGELDETALDYLDLKGITEDEDIAVIKKVVERTGMTVRQALKDEYVSDKLKANQAQREVKAATPSSSKRTGGAPTNDLSAAVAKYESSGYDPKSLPDDFSLRSQVINAVADSQSSNKPSWK